MRPKFDAPHFFSWRRCIPVLLDGVYGVTFSKDKYKLLHQLLHVEYFYMKIACVCPALKRHTFI